MTTEISRSADDRAGDFAPAAQDDVALPYPPSWADRLTAWVGQLPWPSWLVYLALGLGLTLLLLAIAWAGGVLTADTWLNYVRSGMTYAYLLALIHYLDFAARVSLARFRPVLTLNEAETARLRYRLSTLPARPALLASVLGALYGLVTVLINVVIAFNQGRASVSPVVLVLDVGFSLWIYVLFGVVVYHTVHQLRLVNVIYTRYTHIDLFRQGPLYALSGLAARTAVGLGIPLYVWFQTRLSTPGTSTGADLFQLLLWLSLILVTYIWPLRGAHNRLEREKQALQDNVARRIEATLTALHERVDNRELAAVGELKTTLDALVAEQGVIDKLRTWPWRTETVRGVGLAFFLPILIWVVQRVLQRLGI